MVYPVWKAESMAIEKIPIREAGGRIAAKTCSIYPPGIPILLPGELIEENFVEKIEECQKMHLQVQGLSDFQIEVVAP